MRLKMMKCELYQTITPITTLTLSTNSELLLECQKRLTHPEIPNPTKGLDGMMIADKMLKEQNSHGFLIGGLATSVWNANESLLNHKDVDVLVYDDHFKLAKKFEGVIDWWMPKSATGDYNTTIKNIATNWHENGNGAILNYKIKADYFLKPGLYIMNPSQLIETKIAEVMAIYNSINDSNTINNINEKDIDDVINKIKTNIDSQTRTVIRGRVDRYLGRNIFKRNSPLDENIKLEITNIDRKVIEKITGTYLHKNEEYLYNVSKSRK